MANRLSKEWGRISPGSELRLNSLTCSLKPEAFHPTHRGRHQPSSQLRLRPLGRTATFPLWFLLYMVWSSVTNNLRSHTNNSQQGFRLDSKSIDSTIHYLQDCAEGSHKENVLGFSLDTERIDDGKEVTPGFRPDQACLGRYSCK